MLDRYDTAVLKVHQAALDPAGWGDALAAVADVLGSAGAVMHVAALSPSRPSTTLIGSITAEQVASYDAECTHRAAASVTPAPIRDPRSAATP